MTEDEGRLGDKLHGSDDADVDSVEDVRAVREDELSEETKRALEESEGELERGETISHEELKRELGISPENPMLEDALDGLITAANYCDDVGLHELALEIGELYQRLGEEAPEEDHEWSRERDGVEELPEDLREL